MRKIRKREYALFIILFLLVLPIFAGGRSGSTLTVPPVSHSFGMDNVTQIHLGISTGGSEQFDDPQGIFCTKLVCMDDTTTTKDDDRLTVFAINRGRNTIIFNRRFFSVGVIGDDREDGCSFSSPTDITGDNEGNIFVADSGNDRIIRLEYGEGGPEFISEIASYGEVPLCGPEGVAAGGGRLFIADTGNDRIVVTDYDGKGLERIEPLCGVSSMVRPTSVALACEEDEWLYYNDFFIAVIDSIGQRLWKISRDGKRVMMTRREYVPESVAFNDLDCDYYGNIYITDTGSDRIHKFDRNLHYITSIGGGEDIRLDQPRGISIHRRFGQVFVSQRESVRYFWIGTDIKGLTAARPTFDAESGRFRIELSFLLTEHSLVDIYMEDESGKERIPLLTDYILPAGKFDKAIEVDCDRMETLAKCKLRAIALAKPTYSSGEFLEILRKTAYLKPSQY